MGGTTLFLVFLIVAGSSLMVYSWFCRGSKIKLLEKETAALKEQVAISQIQKEILEELVFCGKENQDAEVRKHLRSISAFKLSSEGKSELEKFLKRLQERIFTS